MLLLQSGSVLLKLLWCPLLLGNQETRSWSSLFCSAPPNGYLTVAIHSVRTARWTQPHDPPGNQLGGTRQFPARGPSSSTQRFYGGPDSGNLRHKAVRLSAREAGYCDRGLHLKLQQASRGVEPMNAQVKEGMIADYRGLFLKYGDSPEATGMSSDGHRFRFQKLMEIADLRNRRVLDLGCGIGALYPFLIEKFGELKYTGIDIVPEMVAFAAKKYPRARFLCRDLSTDSLDEKFDYVLISTVFNKAIPDSRNFMRELLTVGFKYCTLGLGFNFISTYVNYSQREMAYFDPAEVLDFCIRNLTRKVVIHHHYERVDVAVFAYC